MAFDIAVRTEDIGGNEDRSWLNTRKGFDTCRSVTLDVSMFLATHTSAKGAIPSGTVLAKITSTAQGGVVNKYGPYDDAATDGRTAAAGFLFNTTTVTTDGSVTDPATVTTDVSVPMLWEGVVSISRLPSFSGALGEIDANAKVNLTHIVFED